MTQEEKDLLLKDLCGRLPYKVVVSIDGYRDGVLKGIEEDRFFVSTEHGINYPIRLCKPYLRPVSDLTFEEFNNIHLNGDVLYNADDKIVISESWETVDYMNEIMIDYRDLIGKGLALEAPEVMYETKTE